METITGLEAQLESAQYGTGIYGADWYVPDPQFGATKLELERWKTKAVELRANMTGYIQGKSGSTLSNGLAIISIYDNKIAKYNEALQGLEPLPPVIVPGDDVLPRDETGIDTDTPVITTGNNTTLYLIGGGLALLFLVANKRKRKKVSGRNSNALPIALGVGALLLLAKKQPAAPPVVTVETGATPEPEAIENKSTYYR